EKSSWVALRHFPQMHTNAVPVLVGGKPIRASRASAKWCVGVIEKLWEVRGQPGPGPRISTEERPEAEKTFQKAIEIYKRIAAERSRRMGGRGDRVVNGHVSGRNPAGEAICSSDVVREDRR